MTYQGTSFNDFWVSSYPTPQLFMAAARTLVDLQRFSDQQLREVYALITRTSVGGSLSNDMTKATGLRIGGNASVTDIQRPT